MSGSRGGPPAEAGPAGEAGPADEDELRWAERYPGLFVPSYLDHADVDIRFVLRPDELDLVTRLHVIACTPQQRVVVCTSVEGWRFLPGGKREPGETLQQVAARELMEEAGAELRGEIEVWGAHEAISHSAEPYRPHWPHPRSLWAYAVCAAEVVTAPTSPADGEVITDVAELEVGVAITFLSGHDQLMADVLALAVDLGLLGSTLARARRTG